MLFDVELRTHWSTCVSSCMSRSFTIALALLKESVWTRIQCLYWMSVNLFCHRFNVRLISVDKCETGYKWHDCRRASTHVPKSAKVSQSQCLVLFLPSVMATDDHSNEWQTFVSDPIRRMRLSLVLCLVIFSLILCNPIDNDSISIANRTQNTSDSWFESRTLSLYTLDQFWKAKGKMKVAFLKFCIFKLRILIQFVSVIFGLTPQNHNQRPYENPYQSPYQSQYPGLNEASAMSAPVPSYGHRWQWHNGHNGHIGHNGHNPPDQAFDYGYDYDAFQFQLLPQDFAVKSSQTLYSLISWFYEMFAKIFNYLFQYFIWISIYFIKHCIDFILNL